MERPNSVIVYGYNKLQQVFIEAVDSNTQCLPFLRKRTPDEMVPPVTEVGDIQLHLTTHLWTPKG